MGDPSMCWWCHTPTSVLPLPGSAPPGAYSYLCGGCVERRSTGPMDALAADVADDIEKRIALLCLKTEESNALRDLVLERLRRRPRIVEPTPDPEVQDA